LEVEVEASLEVEGWRARGWRGEVVEVEGGGKKRLRLRMRKPLASVLMPQTSSRGRCLSLLLMLMGERAMSSELFLASMTSCGSWRLIR
jgi:hypothetical protein